MFKVKPSDIQDGHFFSSVWNNSERETIAGNIVFISKENGDKWLEFSWEDYNRMCHHEVTGGELRYLDILKEEGYLSGDEDTYKPTEKFIRAILLYIKKDVLCD